MLEYLAVMGLFAAFAVSSPAPAAPSTLSVKDSQPAVALVTRHEALQFPRRGAPRLRVIAARRPITHGRTVLPVVGRTTDASGRRWLRVRLPGRPNGSVGWIERAGTRPRTIDVHLVIDISRRRVTVYQQGRAIRAFAAIVGKPSAPTPAGAFFVEEAVALPGSAVGAPVAFALSARSTVYREFAGGPGQIAIHGLANVGGSLGTAVSHGCVRLSAVAMRWLVIRVGSGTPVTIRA